MLWHRPGSLIVLGTVINGQHYALDIVREVANIPEEEMIMTCVAMGYLTTALLRTRYVPTEKKTTTSSTM